MASFTKCDSCDKVAPEATDLMPFGPVHIGAPTQSDGWTSLQVSISRKVPTPAVESAFSGDFPSPPEEDFYQVAQSHLDLCPPCAERVLAALGPAASKVHREASVPPVYGFPMVGHRHHGPRAPLKVV